MPASETVPSQLIAVSAMPTNTTATGTFTSPTLGNVTLATPNGCGTVSCQIVGTYTGQVDFQGSVDGTNYVSLKASNGTSTINATAGQGIFILPGAGYLNIRADVTALSAGSVVITMIASIGTSASIPTGALPAGTNIIGDVRIDQTTPGDTNAVDIRAVPSIAADNHAPADNTAAVVTYAAVSAKKHYLYGIYWAYDATPTGGSIKVEDVSGTTVFGPLPVVASTPNSLIFNPPIVSSAVNTAMIVTLAAGGGSVQGVLSCRHENK